MISQGSGQDLMHQHCAGYSCLLTISHCLWLRNKLALGDIPWIRSKAHSYRPGIPAPVYPSTGFTWKELARSLIPRLCSPQIYIAHRYISSPSVACLLSFLLLSEYEREYANESWIPTCECSLITATVCNITEDISATVAYNLRVRAVVGARRSEWGTLKGFFNRITSESCSLAEAALGMVISRSSVSRDCSRACVSRVHVTQSPSTHKAQSSHAGLGIFTLRQPHCVLGHKSLLRQG